MGTCSELDLSDGSDESDDAKGNTMKIQILGTGCPKCKTLMANAEAAVQSAGIEATVEKVDQIADIMKMGVMITPALAVDGKVVSAGKVLSADDIKKFWA